MTRHWNFAQFNKTKRRRSRRKSRAVQPSRLIQFERLEDRRLLAAQVVDAAPHSQTVAFHEDLFLDLNYEVAAPLARAPQLLGLQLHYDSADLRFVGTTNVLQNGLIGVEDSPETVPDEDANTDRTVTLSWLDVVNPWPGTAALPALLANVQFEALDNEGATTINFTADTSFGYQFEGEPVTVTITPPTFVVDSLGDTPTLGKTTLREAIAAANNNPGVDIVRFAESLTSGGPATITLTEGELLITDAVTIGGPGSELLTIDGNEESRIFSVDDGNGSRAIDVEIRGLTLTRGMVNNGDSGDSCGAIASKENLTVSHSIITENTARLDGGGICNFSGTLTVADSVISQNTAMDDAGGIYNQSGVVKLLRSTVSENLARDDNGGIWNESGTFEVRSSTVSGNISESATGGIRNEDELIVVNSTISGNIAAANNGGIISSGGSATFVSSTISNNRGDSDGIGGHVGGGLRGTNNATITVTNTIIAGNFRGTGTDIDEVQISSGAVFSSGGFNLLADTGSVTSVFDQPGDQVVPTAADFLSPLQDNGGPTHTMALIAGSSAIDAGESSLVPFDVDSDQRGRARFFGVSVDIGAYEMLPDPGFTVTTSATSVVEEAGTSIEATVVLDSPPVKSVVISITTSDASEAKPRFATLVFGPNNWNRPQRVPIDGVQDSIVDGDQQSIITLAVNDALSDDAFDSVADRTITVTTTDDEIANLIVTILDDVNDASDGELSLREAIVLANQQPGADLIIFAASLVDSGMATVTITDGELLISDSVTIQGPGSDILTVDAQENSRILDIATTASAVTIQGVTLTGGQTSAGESGGAIRSSTSGTLSILSSTIIGNSAGKDGGGIFSQGGLSIVNSTVAGNTAPNGGGGIAHRETNAQAEIIASTISGNSAAFGGAFMNLNATASIVNSTISGNSSTSLGGGIVNVSDQVGNEARLLLLQSTITQNSTGAGGAVHSGTQRGATFAEIKIGNSLVVQQLAGNNVTRFDQANSSGATVTSLGHNLVDGRSIGLNAAGDRTDITESVVDTVLRDNGGPTKTHGVLAGSPAIDAGDSLLIPANVDTDQRGRSRIAGTSVDVGAFEFGARLDSESRVTIPAGVTHLTSENGTIFLRNSGNTLFQDERENITELTIEGGEGDETLVVGELGLIGGRRIDVFFDGHSGNDTLRLLDESQMVDLTSPFGGTLQNVEVIDITGTGNNSLSLNLAGVLDLSTTTNLLRIQHDDGDLVSYGAGWSTQIPQVVDDEFVHVLTQGDATIQVVNTRAFQNPLNALDINRDNNVTALDVLTIINRLNTTGAGSLLTPVSVTGLTEFFYYDANGDSFVAPLDVLIIINFLNSAGSNAEGESLGPVVDYGFRAMVERSSFTSTAKERRIPVEQQQASPLRVATKGEQVTPYVAPSDLHSRRNNDVAEDDFVAAIDALFTAF